MAGSNNRSSSKSGLFLIELIVAIMFFSVASGVCIQLFVKAHLLSENSSDLSMALNHAQAAAEAFKASDGSIEDIKLLLSAEDGENSDEITLFYDENRQSSADNPIYRLTLTLQGGDINTATVRVYKVSTNVLLYELTAKKYIGN